MLCTQCGLDLSENEFSIRKIKNVYKIIKRCKTCVKKYEKEYRDKNRKHIQKKNKTFHENNKGYAAKSNLEYRKNNKEKLKALNVIYYINNYEKIKTTKRKYIKSRRKNDLNFKLKNIVSGSVNKQLFLKGFSKNGASILKYLSYTIEELKQHLESLFESWMTWENHGRYNSKTWDDNDSQTWTWQIDHIIPHSSFKYISMEDENFKKCWTLKNLRPFSSKQNVLDGNRR